MRGRLCTTSRLGPPVISPPPQSLWQELCEGPSLYHLSAGTACDRLAALLRPRLEYRDAFIASKGQSRDAHAAGQQVSTVRRDRSRWGGEGLVTLHQTHQLVAVPIISCFQFGYCFWPTGDDFFLTYGPNVLNGRICKAKNPR